MQLRTKGLAYNWRHIIPVARRQEPELPSVVNHQSYGEWQTKFKEQLSEGRKFKVVSNEESCLRNPTQPQLLLDSDVCDSTSKKSAEG